MIGIVAGVCFLLGLMVGAVTKDNTVYIVSESELNRIKIKAKDLPDGKHLDDAGEILEKIKSAR